jgi:hypothetical protein
LVRCSVDPIGPLARIGNEAQERGRKGSGPL